MNWISVKDALPEQYDFLWDGLWTKKGICLMRKENGSVTMGRYAKKDSVFKDQWQEFKFKDERLQKGLLLEDPSEQDITHWIYLKDIQ